MALDAFRQALAASALDLVGVVAAADARPLVSCGGGPDPLSGAGALVVVASGGRGFWERLERRPGEEHPIDRAGQEAIAAALPRLPGGRLLPLDVRDRFDLRRLGALAGLGVVSPHLLLLLHPTFGPWVSIRGLVAVPDALPTTGPLAYDPCGPCPRPCLDACPVGAYSRAAPFDARRCGAHRLASDAPSPPPAPCADRCRARDACVVGGEHRYGDAEMRHRHRAGLPLLRAWLGA
ncbi:MAG: hypothetical protein M9894_11595 [Planctomycetes bacterium]|nr:hypothetical protein [Planctomycetota bacterium]